MKEIPGILVIVRIQFLVPKIAVWMEFLQKTGLELMELVNKVIKVCRICKACNFTKFLCQCTKNFCFYFTYKDVTLKLVTHGEYSSNVGSRLILLDESGKKYKKFNLMNKEFSFDVDVSNMDCGLNGAFYLVNILFFS